MCGIAGWVDYARSNLDTALLERMTRTLTARGPDGGGYWRGDHVALGHRRLAIIDLEGGAQPMTFEQNGRTITALTYNGELYNYRELRQELRHSGYDFHTTGDTEVVLAAWKVWGSKCLDYFNGMYAFALWDAERRELWLARDRLGVKPLYYYPTPSGVIFGSEPKALLTHDAVEPRVGEEELLQLLLPLLKIPGRAPYAGMSEVRPGHILRVSATGRHESSYWAPWANVDDHGDDRSIIESIRALLEDTVERQMIADVPLCTLLSGGLDSSVLTALAQRIRRGSSPVRSFSVDFGDADAPASDGSTDDGPFVKEVVDHLGVAHTRATLDPTLLASSSIRTSCVRARDLPLGIGDLDMSLYLLSKNVGLRSKVAISGEAADEVFGGYRWFHDPQSIGADTFPWMADSAAHGNLHRRIVGYFRKDLLERLRLEEYVADQYRTALAEIPAVNIFDRDESRMREVAHLGITRFLPTLLDRKDRMSMAAGIEVRVPFCDHRLVELVLPLSWKQKTAYGREKSLLKSAAVDILPQSIIHRKKVPYPTTHDTTYSSVVREQLAARLAEPDGLLGEIFDFEALRHASAQAEHGSFISNVGAELALNFDTWIRDYQPTFAL